MTSRLAPAMARISIAQVRSAQVFLFIMNTVRLEVEIQEYADARQGQRAVENHQNGRKRVRDRRTECHRLFVGVAHAQAREQRREIPNHHVYGVVARVETARQGKRRRDRRTDGSEIHHEHRLDDGERVRQACCAEEYPRDDDKAEVDEPLQRGVQGVILLAEQAVKHACRAVHQAPEQEQPARAMPKTADQKDEHQVDAGARHALAAAAEREVDVGRQKTGERDMPSLPELADVQALIRRIEVDRQLDVEHQRNARRHVAIAGEVEIQLEGIADGDEPRFRRVERQRGSKASIHRDGKGIGDDDLFHQAAGEGVKPRREVIEVEAAVFRVGKLGDDFAVQHDRTGDELGEERDKQRVIQNVIARHGAPIAVDDIGKLLKGEERDAQRECDAVERQVQTEGMVHVIKEEIVIFEIEQHAEVD